MTKPTQTLIFKEGEFREWLNKNSFAKNGDRHEQAYHLLVKTDFPRNEEFWQQFVVPLTNRMDPENKDAIIHFREGVDIRLQYICGTNYSLFVHLALANEILKNWNDTSLDAVYARLASAFDVFEGLVIQFHFLLCECRGIKSELVQELKLPEFLKLAEDYYTKEYAKLHEYYISVGKRVKPIHIPTKEAVFGEFFKKHPKRADYSTASGQIRALRNAIVHDVRVGMLINKDKEFLIPKASKVQDYRQWSKVLEAAGDEAKVARDFCEVKAQCQSDIKISMQVINELYGYILEEFHSEFYSKKRPSLRDCFGIKFQSDSANSLPVVLPETTATSSGSYTTSIVPGVSGVMPVSGTINI